MFLTFFFAYCYCEELCFLGYWSLDSNFTNSTSLESEKHPFLFTVETVDQSEKLIYLKGSIVLYTLDIQLYTSLTKKANFYGFYNLTNSIIFLVFSPKKENPIKKAKYVADTITNYTKTSDNYTHESLNQLFAPEKSIYLTEVKGNGKTDYYYINSTGTGSIITHYKNITTTYYITGDKFDVMGYKDEIRAFGVLFGILTLFNLYIQYNEYNRISASEYIYISYISVAINNGFDFAVCFNLSPYGSDLARANYSFLISFAINLSTFLLFSLTRFSKSYDAFHDDHPELFHDINNETLYHFVTARVYSQIFILYAIRNFFSTIVVYPFIWSFIVCSSWVPQIYYSAKYGRRYTVTFSYAICTSIYKLVFLAYLLLYDKSVVKAYSPLTFVIITIWLTLQIIVLYYQSKYGGDFFLPSGMKQPTYDYYDHPVQPGAECPICLSEIGNDDKAMTTPCGHVFHEECLQRWLKEATICPVCRQNLPSPPVPLAA